MKPARKKRDGSSTKGVALGKTVQTHKTYVPVKSQPSWGDWDGAITEGWRRFWSLRGGCPVVPSTHVISL